MSKLYKMNKPYIIIRRNPLYLPLGVTGLVCGQYNGYVAVPNGHPWYCAIAADFEGEESVTFHGGITYTKMEGDMWVIGFDTSHDGDTPEKWGVAEVAKEAERVFKIAERLGKKHSI